MSETRWQVSKGPLFLSSQQLKEQKVAGNRTNEVRAPPTDGC